MLKHQTRPIHSALRVVIASVRLLEELPMPFAVRPHFDWHLRTRTLALGSRTLLMGILNVTPDSFSDGGRFLSPQAALTHALRMLDDGADLLDLGGESTRPGSTPITPAEEQSRVLPVLHAILAARPDAVLSIDTYHAETARLAVEAGAEIVNDVSGHLWDLALASDTCAALGCGAILMHTRGRPHQWRTQRPALQPGEVVPLRPKRISMPEPKQPSPPASPATPSCSIPALASAEILERELPPARPPRPAPHPRLPHPRLGPLSRKSFLTRELPIAPGSTDPRVLQQARGAPRVRDHAVTGCPTSRV